VAAEFASAFVTIVPTTRGARQTIERELGDAGDQAGQDAGENFDSSFKDKTKNIGAGLFAAAGAAGGVALLKGAIDAAADFGETVSKSRNIFGQASADVEKFAATAATSFGISKTAALGAATNFGNIFTQIGFTSEASAKLSTNLIKTAADLGSFNNVDPTDVLDRIAGAMNGEFDSLQQLIPGINAARVEQEALALSGKTAAKELTAQEKVTATLAIITKDGAKAQDDFAETSTGLANQQRILAARFEDAKVAIGEKLLPAAVALTNFFGENVGPVLVKAGDVIRGLSGFVSDNRVVILALATAYAASLAPAMLSVAVIAGGQLVLALRSVAAAAATAATAAAPFIAVAAVVGGAALAFQRGKQEAEAFRQGLEELAGTDVTDAVKFKEAETRLIALRDKLEATGLDAFKDEARAAGQSLDDLRGRQDSYNDAVGTLAGRFNVSRDALLKLATQAKATDLIKDGKIAEATVELFRFKLGADGAAAKAKIAGTNTGKLAESAELYADKAKNASDRTAAFNLALDALIGKNLSLEGSASALEAAYDTVTASFKENGRSLDLNSEKGRANREALRSNAEALLSHLGVLEKNSASSKTLSRAFDEGVGKFRATATAAGLTAEQVDGLVRKYGLIPANKKTILGQKGAEGVITKAGAVKTAIDGIKNKTVTIRANILEVSPDSPLGRAQAGLLLPATTAAPAFPQGSLRGGPTYNIPNATFVTPDPTKTGRVLEERARLGQLAGGGG